MTYTIKGVDWEKELRKLVVLPVFGGRKGRPYQLLKRGTLKLVMHYRPRMYGASVRGKCRYNGTRIYLGVAGHATAEEIREVMLHEIMHLVVAPIRRWDDEGYRRRTTHHPREFKRKMKVALRQAEKKLGRTVVGVSAAVSTGNPLAGLPAAA